jgi:hypothetical protein
MMRLALGTVVLLSVVATAALSQNTLRQPTVTPPPAGPQSLVQQPADPVIDRLKASAGNTPLTCTSSGTVHTCTSEYAWVCPEGWHACPLSPGVKTCCTTG